MWSPRSSPPSELLARHSSSVHSTGTCIHPCCAHPPRICRNCRTISLSAAGQMRSALELVRATAADFLLGTTQLWLLTRPWRWSHACRWQLRPGTFVVGIKNNVDWAMSTCLATAVATCRAVQLSCCCSCKPSHWKLGPMTPNWIHVRQFYDDFRGKIVVCQLLAWFKIFLLCDDLVAFCPSIHP